MERTLHVTAVVTPDRELGGFVARAVDVEVTSQGQTRQEALDALTEALELYFEDDQDHDAVVQRLSVPGTSVEEIDIRLPA